MSSKRIESMPSKVHTYSGRWVDPLDLDPADVVIEDIAHHLSNQCRWSGATKYHYGVAQHSWYCSFLVPEDQAYDALMHDSAEYVLQDMAKPLKNHITLGQAYRGAEARIERVIGPLFNVKFPCSAEVKEADLAMLCAEADQLMHGRSRWSNYKEIVAAELEIVKWTPEKAKKKFLARFAELSPE